MSKSLYDQYLDEREKKELPFDLFQRKVSNLLMVNSTLNEETATLQIISAKKSTKYAMVKLSDCLKPNMNGKLVQFNAKVLNISEVTTVKNTSGAQTQTKNALLGDGKDTYTVHLWNEKMDDLTRNQIGSTVTVQGVIQEKIYKGTAFYYATVHEVFESDRNIKVSYSTIKELVETKVPLHTATTFRVVSVNTSEFKYKTGGVGACSKLLVQDLTGTAILLVWHNSTDTPPQKNAEYTMYSIQVKIVPDKLNEISCNAKQLNVLKAEQNTILASITNMVSATLQDFPSGISSIRLKVKDIAMLPSQSANSEKGAKQFDFSIYTLLDTNNVSCSFVIKDLVDRFSVKLDVDHMALFRNVYISKYYDSYRLNFTPFSEIQRA